MLALLTRMSDIREIDPLRRSINDFQPVRGNTVAPSLFLFSWGYSKGCKRHFLGGFPSALCAALRLVRNAEAQPPPAGISPDAVVAATLQCYSGCQTFA
jgi:hypothetical protein